MKKILMLVLVLISCLFLSCKNEKNQLNTANTENLNLIEKYLNFFDQEDNVVIAICFRDKDFLSEEEWKDLTVLDLQEKFQENLGSFRNYILVIANDDIKECNIRDVDGREIPISSLKKGERFVIKNYENSFINIIMTGEEEKIIDFYGNQGFREYYDENGERIIPDYGYAVLSWYKYEEFSQTEEDGNISEEIDLDGDGKFERVIFSADEANQTGKFTIDEKEYETHELLNLANIEILGPISNLEILDIDKNDKYKEIVFRISYEGEIPESYFILFHYENGDLKYLGSLEYDYEGLLARVVDSENALINIKKDYGLYLDFPYSISKMYKIKNEKLILETKAEDMKYFNERIVGVVKKPINIYESTDSNKSLFRAKEGSTLLFLETDHKNWIKVKDFETGTTGYIRFIVKTEKINEEENGEYSYIRFFEQEELGSFPDVFTNLPEIDI